MQDADLVVGLLAVQVPAVVYVALRAVSHFFQWPINARITVRSRLSKLYF